MAVAFNSSSSYRADFMVTEASASQRVKNTQIKQDDGFSRLLDNRSQSDNKPTGSVNSSGTVNEKPTTSEQSVSTEFADSKQMASYVDSKEVKTELDRVCEVPDKESLVMENSEGKSLDIPDDVMELARDVVSGEVDIKDVPVEKITVELLMAIVVVNKLEVSKEDDEEEKPLTDEMQIAAQQNAFSFVDNLVATIVATLEENGNDALASKIEAIGKVMSESTFTVDVTINVEKTTYTIEIPAELLNVNEEMADVQKDAVNAMMATQVADDVAGEVVTDKPQVANTLKAENTAQTTNTAKTEVDANGEVIVRKVSHTEESSEFAQQGNSEQNSAFGQRTAVTKEISEELEMLRNAKSGKNKTEAFEIFESTETVDTKTNADESTAVRTANPLMADSPIVLAGKDGMMIEVRPSEIVSQVTKLVEQAITTNNDATEYSMVLNPEEMGRITVKLIKAADGSVSVTIVAENASTQRLLEQNGELMQSSLRNNGVQLQSWQTVNEAHQETMQREYEGSSKNPYYREENENGEEQPDEVSFADIIAAM